MLQHHAEMFDLNIPKDRAAVMFKIQTSSHVDTVHLVGSWDNFSSPLLMKEDSRVSLGLFKICLGSCKSNTGTLGLGLKMGARYTYYFMIDGKMPIMDSAAAERQVDQRTGIVCSVLHVPVDVAPGIAIDACTTARPDVPFLPRHATSLPTQRLGIQRHASESDLRSTQRIMQRPLNLLKRSHSTLKRRNSDDKDSSKVSSLVPMRPAPPTSQTSQYPVAQQSRVFSRPTPSRPTVIIPQHTTISNFNSYTNPNTPYLASLPSTAHPDSATTLHSFFPQSPDTLSSPVDLGGERRRLGFHIKAPSLPSLASLFHSNTSRNRSHFPSISNPISMNVYEPQKDTMVSPKQYDFHAFPSIPEIPLVEGNTLDTTEILGLPRGTASPLSRCTSIDSTASSVNPSLTQSEFSISSSPRNRMSSSTISSSPMGSDFDSEFSISDDEEDDLNTNYTFVDKPKIHIRRSYRRSLRELEADNLNSVESWYRNALSKPRISDGSNMTRFSNMSSVTQFEDIHEEPVDLKPSGRLQRAASPYLYAPMPQRVVNEAIITIEDKAQSHSL